MFGLDKLNITIIGGDGYIGKALSGYLDNDGHNVEVFDRKRQGVPVQDFDQALPWADVVVFMAAFPGAEACN